MAWDLEQSRKRIVDVAKRFAHPGVSLLPPRPQPDALRLASGKALVLSGVHVFVKITNFDAALMDVLAEDTATRAAPIRTLASVYRAFDFACDSFGMLHIDYDGPCMQALSPGLDDPQAQVRRAVEFCVRMTSLLRESATSADALRLSFGIDLGPAVGLYSGRSSEPAPLVLGRAVDHAIKIAPDRESGIYLSATAARALAGATTGGTASDVQDGDVAHINIDTRPPQPDPDRKPDDEPYAFHYYPPPLEKLDFPELTPQKTVRMELVSLYAGVSGYADWLDKAIAAGDVSDAVRFIYVLRWELNDVVRCDFGGQKVRFVREAMHGILAEGNSSGVDRNASIATARRCAEAMRSSFELCRELLKPSAQCALTVGAAYGTVCINGLGAHAVRTVLGPCVAKGLRLQLACKPGQISFAD